MIGIICFWDRPATPYLKKYEDVLDQNKIEYEVIFWNRDEGNIENCYRQLYINIQCNVTFYKKILKFLQWRRTVLQILKVKEYDKIIVLTTVPAFLLYNYLVNKYSTRYLLDIRDYTFEKNVLFSNIIEKLVDHSAFTTISSKGFFRWLAPSEKIVPNHNITYYSEDFSKQVFFEKDSCNFTFVGNIRLDVQTRMVLKALKNYNHINCGFVGRILPSCDIKEFCAKESIINVYFSGMFSTSEKPDIYKNIDLINAVYANSPADRLEYGDSTPIPNRIYDCAVFQVPIVCCKGTYLEEIVNEYNLGFAIDAFNDDVYSCIQSYINAFDRDLFINGCKNFIDKIKGEEAKFISRLKNFLT